MACGPEQQRVSPDAIGQAGRERVVKLQQALDVLGETSGPEVDGLRSALEKAKKLSSDHGVQEFHRPGRETRGWSGCSATSGGGISGEGRARLQRLEPSPPEGSSEVPRLKDLVGRKSADRVHLTHRTC